MSLYRKYRPQTFADVVGQEHIVTTLEQAAVQGKLAHAYLFAGSRGIGKTSVARILAKVIMMQRIEDETLCRQIDRGVQDGSIVDLLEIDAASTRGIDAVRDLIGKIQFSPVAASAKVYIIDEVHMLTKEAFNALLKTLEEPPPYAYFILATTEMNKIPLTIQSRCQCFPFRNIRDEDIIRRLQYIADQEHITIDREALRFIAHSVDGGLRDAISLLDQMRSLEHIAVKDVEQRIGTTGREYVEDVLNAVDANDGRAIIEIVRKIEDAGIPLDAFLRQILAAVRRGLHELVQEGEPIDRVRGMLSVLLEAIRDVRAAPVPGVVAESALLSLLTPAGGGTAIPRKEAAQETPPKKKEPPAPEPQEPVKEKMEFEAPELTRESLQENWQRILKETVSHAVRMSLKNGRIVRVDKKTVTIGFSSAFERDKVAGTDAARAIEGGMEKIFKRHIKLECTIEEGENGNGSGGGDAVNLAEAAAEVF